MLTTLVKGDKRTTVKIPIERIFRLHNQDYDALTTPSELVSVTTSPTSEKQHEYWQNTQVEWKKHMIDRCDKFPLLEEQLLVAATLAFPFPKDRMCYAEITREGMHTATEKGKRKQGFFKTDDLEADKMPRVAVLHLPTGTGKTAVAGVAALARLSTVKIDDSDVRKATLNVSSNSSSMRTATPIKVAIFCVPDYLVEQWSSTLASMLDEAERVYGKRPVLVTGKYDSQKRVFTLAMVGRDTVLWVMGASEYREVKPLRKTPGYVVPLFVWDELASPARSKWDQPESVVLNHWVVQATVEKFKGVSNHHPLAKAMGGSYLPPSSINDDAFHSSSYTAIDGALQQICWMQNASTIAPVRKALSEAAMALMPEGLLVQKVTWRVATLAGAVHGPGLVPISLGSLLRQAIVAGHAIAEEHLALPPMPTPDLIVAAVDKLFALAVPPRWEVKVNAASLTRLRNHLLAMRHEEPECPVLLSPIPKERVVLCTSCTAVLDKATLRDLGGKCPLCRARLEVAEVDGAPPADEPVSLPSDLAEQVDFLTAKRLTAEVGVPLLLAAASRPLRALVVSRYTKHDRTFFESFKACIQSKIPGVHVQDADEPFSLQEYNDPQTFPRSMVLILNASKHVNSISGLDLVATNLTYIDRAFNKADEAQAVGRCLRMGSGPREYKRILFGQ